jgi:SAM-dependent methyltransferase
MDTGIVPDREVSVVERIWTAGAAQFMAVRHTSQEMVLHPAVADIVNAIAGSELLDFGAGDGRIMALFDERFRIDAYDNSEQMRNLLRALRQARLRAVFDEASDIQPSRYDVVLLSMVLICIASDAEVLEVLTRCFEALRQGGTLVIAVTHPCFRREVFSNFRTAYTDGTPFRYLEDGAPFTVTLEDTGAPSVTFTDYHWSIQHTLTAVARAGLTLTGLFETGDDETHPRYNATASPFLILTCSRLRNE